VRFNQLGEIGGRPWFRSYILTTDPGGSQNYFRGRPSSEWDASPAVILESAAAAELASEPSRSQDLRGVNHGVFLSQRIGS
jgi:hypothetical protein